MWGRHAHLLKTRRVQVLALAVVFVTAATFVLIPRHRSSQPDAAAPDVQPQAAAAAPDTAPPPATTGAARTARAARRAPAARSNASESASGSASKPIDVAPVPETTRVASAATVPAQEPPAVTITGCLEREDAGFRLKDTEGETAPRSRSWKTGFLKRTTRSVDVVDTQNQFNLAGHVGERVNATGTLVGGDMQLRSLRRVARSCEKEA